MTCRFRRRPSVVVSERLDAKRAARREQNFKHRHMHTCTCTSSHPKGARCAVLRCASRPPGKSAGAFYINR